MDKPFVSPCNCPSECDICPGINIFIPVNKVLIWVFPLTRASHFSPPCLVVQELKIRMPCMLQNSLYSDVHANCLECLALQPDTISSSLLLFGSLQKHFEGKNSGMRIYKQRCTTGCRHSEFTSCLWESTIWFVTGTDVTIIGLVVVQRNGGFVCL